MYQNMKITILYNWDTFLDVQLTLRTNKVFFQKKNCIGCICVETTTFKDFLDGKNLFSIENEKERIFKQHSKKES
jgi:hypothetical protein